MKPVVAGLMTAGILAIMLFLGSRSPAPTTDDLPAKDAREVASASPAEEAVRGLLRSGQDGDVPAYLASFSGPLKERLVREVEERGREAFADDLRRSAAARRSHAVFGAEPEGDDVARVVVETVYPDRNERQTFRIEKTAGGWLVADVATVKTHQPAAKFGTPASYIAPEGVPVPPAGQGGLTVESGDDPDAP